MNKSQLKQKANKLPSNAGVYIMKNALDKIIYIGKAKHLKNRVTQYFGLGNQHSEKVKRMVENVADFEYIICDSEFEALILENSLIKQNQPKYNILLKDDKGYHYIKITNDKWPKIQASKILDASGEFIGPYNSGYVVRETVDEARKIFKLPDCNRNFDTPSKPCLNYHIGICSAPCKHIVSIDEYKESINSAVDFIKNGSINIDSLNAQMLEASNNLNFEKAAKLRDRINAIKKIKEHQKVVMISQKSQDIIASAMVGSIACVEILIFRNYRLTDKKHFFFEDISDKQGLYDEFIPRYYNDKTDIPSRILIDSNIENAPLFEQWLESISKHRVKFLYPQKGEQRALVDMCLNNAADNLSVRVERSGREMSALNELAELLGLSLPPRYIEAYDISNTAGSANVAGMVVFEDGRPLKNSYRKFKIKSFVGQDDYRSLKEVLSRRFEEYKKGTDTAFSRLPDLILLDGGKGQVSAVKPILSELGLDIALFGMVKNSKHKTSSITDGEGNITIKANKKAFTLVTAIQDEVHRYAITFHKNQRKKAMLSSELKNIEGIGSAKADKLLKHFKTLEKIKLASVDELASIKGITKQNALLIFEYFNK